MKMNKCISDTADTFSCFLFLTTKTSLTIVQLRAARMTLKMTNHRETMLFIKHVNLLKIQCITILYVF